MTTPAPLPTEAAALPVHIGSVTVTFAEASAMLKDAKARHETVPADFSAAHAEWYVLGYALNDADFASKGLKNPNKPIKAPHLLAAIARIEQRVMAQVRVAA